jgi:hypothetical protein
MVQVTIIRIIAHLLRSWLASMCLCLSCVSNSLASVDICQDPPAEAHLSIAYVKHDESSFERSLGETRQENFDIDLQFQSNDKWAFGAGHRYTILNVSRLELQTNGHLHTFFLPVHRMSQADRNSFRFSFAPALSASSNVMKDPGEYRADALQLLAALVWNRQVSEHVGIHYGICGDHRFGSYQIYPLIGVDWELHPDWMIELGFPASQLSYQVSKSLTSLLRIAPDGNEWYVRDESLENQSQLVYQAYTLEWAISWQAREHFSLTGTVGIQFHNRYELTLLDNSRDRLSSESVTRIGAALAWRF